MLRITRSVLEKRNQLTSPYPTVYDAIKLNVTNHNLKLQQSFKAINNPYSNLKLQKLWFTLQNKQPTKKTTYLPNKYAQSVLMTLCYI